MLNLKSNGALVLIIKKSDNLTVCGGIGTDTTVPTNTVQVPITTGTVTDSGSEYTYWLYWGDKWIYIQDR